MNTKRYALAAVAVFAFIFLFEWVWHGILLKDMYQKTMSVWRPEADMMHFFPLGILIKAAIALILTFIFTRHYEGGGLSEGLRFGTYIGLLLAVMNAGWYPYLPVPAMLAALWAAGGLIMGLGVGAVASLVYKN
jgi:hypothetical protein